MHVRTRKLAFAGLMLAVTIVCLYLGNIIESNTLFLLAGASYFVGIVYREAGAKMSLAFYVGALILGFLVTPNKFYILTYAAMGLYILFNEWAYFKIRKKENIRRQSVAFWIVKYLVFNVMYLPGIWFFQKLLFARTLPVWVFAGVVAAGQIAFFLYDRAYEYVQGSLWNKVRNRWQ